MNDEEEDPWDARIALTGCFKENERLQICRYDTGDWRQCVNEMKAFRECWERHKNNARVSTIDISLNEISNGDDLNLTGTKHGK